LVDAVVRLTAVNRAGGRLDGRGASALDIRLLGPIGAERDGEPASLGGPRQRAVLARLAIAAGQIVTVDRLLDDVWAGEPPTTAVNTLQSYVSLLRRALGDPRHLRREGPGYVLTVSRDQIDAARFEDLVAAGRTALTGAPRDALTNLDAALDEWRGPGLAEVADEEWARPTAARWDQLRLTAFEARFDALLALGRHVDVVGELERATDEHPSREGLARRLMIALYRSGRQADALRAFARTQAVLSEQLGLDATPELVELQTAILNHDPDLALPPSPAPPVAAPPDVTVIDVATATATETAPGRSPVPLPGPALRCGTSDFVGREGQLAALHRIWDGVLAGQSHFVLLVGEAGAGKSRLAARFAAEVHEQGAVVLWGRATAEAIVPFEPMVEAIRTALRTISPEARRRVAGERGHLSLLLPELEQLVPEVRTAPAEPGVERYLLFESVAEVLRSESAGYPLLIVLDDLHWADAPSLKLIEHVLRHEQPGRVMVVGAARAPADAPTPELDRLAIDLGRDRLLSRVVVNGLATSEVGELLRAGGRDTGLAGELHAATGGNAFFLTELIRHGDGAPLGGELPESIRAMVGVRLDRLDRTVTHVLNLTAIAGPAATLPVLERASGLDGDRLLDAVDTALAAGLIVEDGAGRLAMPHALIGQAVVSRLGRTRRLDLHRRIAEALEQAGEPQSSPGTLAHHLIEAGSLADRAQRVTAALVAGRHALDVAAYEDATRWCERLEALVTERTDPARRTEAAVLRSDTARARGDREAALAAAREAAEVAQTTDDPMLLAQAAERWMLALSAIGFDIGEPADPELVALLERVIATLPDHESQYQVRMRSMLASVLVASSDGRHREALAAEALAIAQADGRPELVASAQLARRLALWQLDRLDERTEAVLVAVDEARRAGNVHLELTATLFAMSDLLEQGRVEHHLRLLAEFRSRATDLHMPLYLTYALFIEAGHRLAAGDYREAERLADEALALGKGSHGVNAEIVHGGIQYLLAQDRGNLAATLPVIEQMAAAHPRLRMWRIAMLGALLDGGRYDEGRRIFESFVGTRSLRLLPNQIFLPAACALAQASAQLGDPTRAVVLHQILERYADRLAVSGIGGISVGSVSRYAGLAAHAGGDLDAAERLLTAAVAVSGRHGMRAHEARARHDLAAVLAGRGRAEDQARAAAERHTARALAEELGLVLGSPQPR
jgi:DNA-binding SARP family transcriptional activator/tetratricopeptide (TPR) repeat protein